MANGWMARVDAAGGTVITTRDWHPPDHCSFCQVGVGPSGCWLLLATKARARERFLSPCMMRHQAFALPPVDVIRHVIRSRQMQGTMVHGATCVG